jgi:hypothetical protein
VPGKEREGREALERYLSLPVEERRGEPQKQLMGLEISGRLKNDVCELLGNLHAEEAVPMLVEIMEREEIHDLIPGMTPVMRALAAIGPPAVPRLIESVEMAEVTASTFPFSTADDPTTTEPGAVTGNPTNVVSRTDSHSPPES